MSAQPHDEILQKAGEVLDFWLGLDPAKHYAFDAQLDQEIGDRFSQLIDQAIDGKCDDWAENETAALALAIVLDQFNRNANRGTPRMYQGDEKAVKVGLNAVDKGWDLKLKPEHRRWFYMPFMHSENLDHQNMSVSVFENMGHKQTLEYAHHHRSIIQKFGRFPHRNKILGRTSTQQELEFIEQGGFNPK